MTRLDQLQMPFLERDLLPLSSFISYCRSNDVYTDKSELESLAQQRILYPAIRIVRGYVEYRKILRETTDGKKEWVYIYPDDLDKFIYIEIDEDAYYTAGSISHGNDGWTEWFGKRGMLKYPSSEPFISWSKFEEGSSFGKSINDYDNASMLMYDKHQIFPLQEIQEQRSVLIKNESFTKSFDQWIKMGESIAEIYEQPNSTLHIKKTVSDWYDFFNFLMDVRHFLQEKNDHIRIKCSGLGLDRKELTREHEALSIAYDNNVVNRNRASSISAKHSFKLDNIEHWRFRLLNYGSFGKSGNKSILRAYVARLDNELLDQAEDAYRIVNQLSWFTHMLGGKEIYAKQLILKTAEATCPFCGRSFVSGRSTQKTCASDACKRQLRNRHKRELRRSNRR